MIHGVILSTLVPGELKPSATSRCWETICHRKLCRGTTAAAHSIQLSHWQLWVPFHVLNVRGTWLFALKSSVKTFWDISTRRCSITRRKTATCSSCLISFIHFFFVFSSDFDLSPVPPPLGICTTPALFQLLSTVDFQGWQLIHRAACHQLVGLIKVHGSEFDLCEVGATRELLHIAQQLLTCTAPGSIVIHHHYAIWSTCTFQNFS